MKKLLTLVQGFGAGVFLASILLLQFGQWVGEGVAIAGLVLTFGALITSQQGGDIR